jgi:hypothetical protein
MKNFPKAFVEHTAVKEDSYPLYRRRSPAQGGNAAMKSCKTADGTKDVRIDNSWVVPYNPALLMKYQSHLNVEVCSTVKAVK